MIGKSINKIVSIVLLTYFALFIVPPVSSFAAFKGNPGPETAFSEKRIAHSHATQFLFDIIVWQQFKKTKQSDLSTAVHFDLSQVNRPVLLSLLLAVPVLDGLVLRLFAFGRTAAASHRVRSALIVFSRSGCSPPEFSVR